MAGQGHGSFTYLGNFWNSYGYDGNTNSNGTNGGPTTVGNYYSGVVGVPIAVEEAAQGTDVPEETPYTLNYLTNYTFPTGPFKDLGVGGGLRWMSTTVEGYYGATQANLLNASGQVAASDITKPIYTRRSSTPTPGSPTPSSCRGTTAGSKPRCSSTART